MTSAPSGRRLLLLTAFLAFVSIGFPDAVLGVAWPSIRETFGRPRADLGFILFGAGAGYFLSGAFSGKAIERLGVGRLLTVSTTCVALGLLGYVVSLSFWVLLAVAALIGCGSGAVDAGLNYYASEHFSMRVMNWMHAFFGIGAMIGPFIMAGVLSADLSWRVGYAIVATGIALMAITFAFTSSLWTDQHHAAATEEAPTAVRSRDALRLPLVWLQMALFFFMTGVEASAGAWAFTLLTERFEMDKGPAGLWAGMYWGAIAAGRLLLPTITHTLAPSRVVQLGCYGLVVGALLMVPNTEFCYLAGLVLFGLAMAPMFPTLMSLTPIRLGKRVSMHAIGFQVSMAVAGGVAIPSLAGVLSDRSSHAAIPVVILIGVVVVTVLESRLRTLTPDGVPSSGTVEPAAA